MPVDHGRPVDELELFEVHPLSGTGSDYDWLVEQAAGMKFVLVGDASHGTHEFHRERAEITKRLIADAGYSAVAVEADWPDAYRVNDFVRCRSDDQDAAAALADFRRFPAWMWRNTDMSEFVRWLRRWNDELPSRAPKVGFYGLDLYSLHRSMEVVIEYLEEVDHGAAERARRRYARFDDFGGGPDVYAPEAGMAPCERQAIDLLVDLQQHAKPSPGSRQNGQVDPGRHFFAQQNARLGASAERYYRAAFRGGADGWNLRNRHMADTLEALTGHLERVQGPAKVVVWAHNSHLGDARATEMSQGGRLNVGQLVRERHDGDTLLIGFTTFDGTVTAASRWGGEPGQKPVRPGMDGSWEELFHRVGDARFVLETEGLHGRRPERAMGVTYLPETERFSHYFNARMSDQFDAVIHIDRTSAVEPLERASELERGELPETYPWGVQKGADRWP